MKINPTNSLCGIFKGKSPQGFTLTELLVAIVIGAIVLTASAVGMTSLLKSNSEIDAKSMRNSQLTRALAFIQEEIKNGVGLEPASGGTCNSGVDSQNCLKITNADGSEIFYGFEDISSGAQTWQKPAVLKRREVDTAGTAGNWQVIVDGLLGANEQDPNPTCTFGQPIYGQDANNKGGFRFCLNAFDVDLDGDGTNDASRRGEIFLYGYILSDDAADTISVKSISVVRIAN